MILLPYFIYVFSSHQRNSIDPLAGLPRFAALRISNRKEREPRVFLQRRERSAFRPTPRVAKTQRVRPADFARRKEKIAAVSEGSRLLAE